METMTALIENSTVKLKKVSYDPFSSSSSHVILETDIKSAPTTEAQKEMWSSIQMDEQASLCYNECLVLEFDGIIDIGILEKSFKEILNRHDALRSTFSDDGKNLIFSKSADVQIERFDLRQLSLADELLEALTKKEITTKFDVVNGPCIRAKYILLPHQKSVFLLSIHHLVCDGWSFGIILKELAVIYNRLSGIHDEQLESAPQFSEYAQKEAQREVSAEDRRYWIENLSSLKTKSFPVDYERSLDRSFCSKRIDIAVPELTVKSLKRLSLTEKCSFYNTLVGAFTLFIGRLTVSDEVVIGLASAQQSAIGEFDLVGHMVNLLPLKTELKNEQVFNEYLKTVRRKMFDAFDHQQFSYGSIVKNLPGLARRPGEIPLLNVVFNIDQQVNAEEMRFGAVQAKYRTIPRDYENFEIFINAVSSGDYLNFECQYNSELFSLSTLTNWLHSFVEMLATLEESRHKPLAEIELKNLKRPVAETTTPSLMIMRNLHPDEESLVISTWKKILLVDDIKNTDHFFALGGHSLLAIETAQALSKSCGQKISLKDIFKYPTVAELAGRIHELRKSESKGSLQSINSTPIAATGLKIAELSHNQLQIWYLEEIHPKTLMHNLPAALRIKARVDLKLLKEALTILVERHPAMRTSLSLKNGRPVQRIHEADEIKWDIKFQKTRESALLTLLNEEADFCFDKSAAPLFKTALFELAPDDNVFFFMVHHAVWDGWCFDIFFEELSSVYQALSEKRRIDFLPKIPVHYLDYSSWVKTEIESGGFQDELNFWKKELQGPLPILDLPVDFRRPAKAGHRGGTVPFQLSETQAYIVREYAKLNGVSLFNVFLTAFKISLSLNNEAENQNGELIVGLPVRGRSHPEVMNTIGYFVNTVALRTKMNLQASFEENLKTVSEKCREAFDHQALPFQIILNELNSPRDASRTPVFQSFFSFQDVSNRSSLFNGTKYTQINIDRASTHTDLDLWIKASSAKIEGAFEFRSDLFKEVSIVRFSEIFLNVIDHLMINVRKPLHLTNLLPEKHQVVQLQEWNDTAIKREFKSVIEDFQFYVKENPLKNAIEAADETITYRELDQMARKLAGSLKSQGVNKGDIVGLSLTRESKLIVSLLGIMYAGAAYLPLDPNFPQDRLEMMIEDAAPKFIITNKELSGRFKNKEILLLIHELFSAQSLEISFQTFEKNSSEDLLYTIFTSGSTGRPKGVEITHGNVHNFLQSMKARGLFSQTDKMLAVTTLSFDIAVLELFLPLTSGGSLYLAQSHQVVDGESLAEIMERKKITVLQATPSTWRLLLGAGWKGNKNLRSLCGGEAFPPDLAQALVPICKEVWNMYGPTETTVWSACKKLTETDEQMTIGHPIDNTHIYILDEDKKLRPIGRSGEIYIGGQGLARGYKGRPDLTLEKFSNDPFRPGEKIYATGDLGRLNAGGEIICLGRNDSQVKIRGFRIELGEIESALLEIEEIKEACVVTKEVRTGDVRILAYIKAVHTDSFNEKIIKSFLTTRLPVYMLPAHYLWQDELPKTLNGKIDRKSLPPFTLENELAGRPLVNEFSLNSSDEKTAVAGKILNIFRKTLGNFGLTDEDNFFDAGGNSLMAVTLMSEINDVLKISMPLATLIEAKNIREFVNLLEGDKKSVVSYETVPKVLKSLVAIHSKGNKNPVYFFHGVGGNILNYVSLLPVSKKNRPLMALQSYGLDGVTEPLNSIEEMARHYIREIKMLQPEGPYLLAGGSMGGMIAFEVARQLRSNNDEVEKIIMLDTFGPNLNLKNFQQEMVKGFFSRALSSFKYRSALVLLKLQSSIYHLMGQSLPLPLLLKQIERNNYKAIWNYRPGPYHGDLHIIRSNSVQGWYADPDMGWKGIIKGKIFTYRITGNHGNFIESTQLVDVLSKLV